MLHVGGNAGLGTNSLEAGMLLGEPSGANFLKHVPYLEQAHEGTWIRRLAAVLADLKATWTSSPWIMLYTYH